MGSAVSRGSRFGGAAIVAVLLVLTDVAGVGAAAPSNDNFASAQQLLPASGGTLSTTNADATKEAGEPDHAGFAGGASIWFSWTPSFTGTASVDTKGSELDTLLAAYSGSTLGSLTRLASNDDVGTESSPTSRICFHVNAGSTYRVAVDS